MFAVTSHVSAGCTFLEWSIHWLSGQTEYYNNELGMIPLTSDPLTAANSHNHRKNHPVGYHDTLSCINKLTINNKSTNSFYPGPLSPEVVPFVDPSIDIHNSTEVLEYISHDYKKLWQACSDKSIPLIYVKLSDPVYFNLGLRIENNKPILDQLKMFFSKDLSYWFDDLKMNQIWDLREFMALNLRPNYIPDTDRYIDFTKPHMYINAHNLFFDGLGVYLKVLDYLNLTADENRFASWESVYTNWQKIHLTRLNFSWHIDHICESIVNNYEYNLDQFDLDLTKEAIIQHFLIYKYNLNLKTYDLTKFPSNTKYLHSLLEENFHPVDRIYSATKC